MLPFKPQYQCPKQDREDTKVPRLDIVLYIMTPFMTSLPNSPRTSFKLVDKLLMSLPERLFTVFSHDFSHSNAIARTSGRRVCAIRVRWTWTPVYPRSVFLSYLSLGITEI